MNVGGGRSAGVKSSVAEPLTARLTPVTKQVSRLWHDWRGKFLRFVEPRDPSLSVEERLRVIILNALLLTVVPVVPFIAVAAASIDTSAPGEVPPVIVTLAGVVSLALCYPIHRAGRYHLARWLAMAVAAAMIFAQTEIAAPPYADVLYFLALPVGGIILFSRRENLALSAICIALMLWSLSRKPGVTVNSSYDLFLLSILLSVLLMVVSLYRDLLEQKRSRILVEQEGQIRLERERMRLLTEFLQSASHDLRTPLTQINLSVHLMGRAADSDVRSRQQGAMTDAVGTLQTLLNRMFYVVELERLTTANMRTVYCNELLASLESYAAPLAERAGIAFRLEVADALPPLHAHPHELRSALIEVINNALDNTPEGGRITLSADAEPGSVLIALEDTGRGIPTEALPRIFDMFYRTEAHRPINGQHSGLGLAIARKIVSAHGGTISLESTPGRGTLVQIRLPA
ncbi:MAG: HAMP domain-containing histidine kinase [Anaerolineae bacterium]|nr:HAMP domain-containing histidine kinase [Anaerolineae bacterium]